MKKQNKDKIIGVRFTVKEYKRIKKKAEEADRTISDYIRDIVLNGKRRVSGETATQTVMEVLVQAREILNYVSEKYGGNEVLEEKVKGLWRSLS